MPERCKTRTFKLCHCCYKWQCNCLIPREAKRPPPFNSGTKLDSKTGLHPKLQASTFTKPAVGSYNPRDIKYKTGVISWKKEKKSEEFSATMGGKSIKAYESQKNLMKIGCGPGTHEILRWPEDNLKITCKSLLDNTGFGTVSRFEPSYKSTTPGPGYTLKVHNPYYYLDQKRLKSLSNIPSFEFDSVPRFRKIERSWSLPCNLYYKVKYMKSFEAFLEKRTGKRGPYDLFTGPRDDSTIKGYWTHVKLDDINNWPIKLPDGIEKFLSRSKYFHGRWSTNPRFIKKPVTRMMLQDISTCYKDPDEPGPASYDPQKLRKPSPYIKYPFDSNIEYVRPFQSDISPGPGRYKLKEDHRIKGDGWKSIFKSQVPRTTGVIIPSTYRAF